MALNRRGFINGLLGAIGAAATLDADELLWVPGAKLISVPMVALTPPPLPGWLTEGEKYLCAAMGISNFAYVMRRAELHEKNPSLPAGYFRKETWRPMLFKGASADDPVVIMKELFPRLLQVI
jgi:hypothetical protein